MRKFYLFFALLIGISGAAWATDFTPEEGAIYTIRNKGNKDFVIFNSGNNNGSEVNILSSWSQFDERSFFIIKGNATDGYTLQIKNEPARYVYWLNKNDEDANVGTKTVDAEVPEDCKWQIVENGTGTWNIKPLGGSNGWNRRGWLNGNHCIGQWVSNGTNDNLWYIQKPTEMAPGSSVADNSSNTVGLPTQAWLATGIPAHNAATTLEGEFTSENATAFYTAWAASSLPVSLVTPSQPASGLFKIRNVGTGKYLFQSEENNAKGVTLLNDGGDNFKYYWTANFSGNDVTLKGSLGQAPKRGGQGVVYASIAGGIVMNTITMEGAPSGSAEYTANTFLWPKVHSTIANDYTISYAAYNSETNPAFLTTWGTTGTADQYVFEPVTFSGSEQIYTVSVDRSLYNSDANVTLNEDSYTGNKTVHDGGFFVLTSAPTAGQFSATAASGSSLYVAQVAVSGNTIQVTYAADEAQVSTVVAEATNFVASSAANKVGYPNSTSAAYTELNDALNAYNADNTSEEKRMTLFIKYENYKKSTTNIALPVDGKAYKITAVFPTGVTNTLYWNASNTAFKAKSESAIADPLSKVLVCRANTDGTFTFVSNSGKYLLWFCDSDNAINQSGYSDEYSTNNNWTLERAVVENVGSGNVLAGTTNADFVGRLQIKAKGKNGNNWYLNGRYEGESADAAFISQWAADKFYDNNHNNNNHYRSYTYTFEEVDYANVVSLKDASTLESGKNIATFSAPFPTVVPANTTAYSVETQTASDVTEVSTYKVAEAGQAIPANTGVILMGTDTQVTMLPRTTETTVEIAAGALGNSAGAAKNITTENSYVLSKQSSTWAFYKVGTGATDLPMNKAYLVLPNGTSAGVIRFNFGNTTGMELVGADAAAAQGKVYDLSGREVKVAAKGLYIVGSKKVIVK
ncbi:MAG: hypothetical protein SPK31_06045 [Alloprevotella sp.]|nr:hypothetical protein [Prevotellamassilia sp.]MDY5762645.1 hypothetical protein [Alloprevotella sp.]